MLYGQKNASGI